MTADIKVMTLTQEHLGRILIINGDFRFADEIFGAAAPIAAPAATAAVAVAGTHAAAAPQAAAAAPRAVKDFDIHPGEKNLDAVNRWAKYFVTEESNGSVSMGAIRDATPPSIIGLYSSENSARSAVTTAIKNLVDAGVLAAPDEYKKHSLIITAPVAAASTDAAPVTQTAPETAPAEVVTQAPETVSDAAVQPATDMSSDADTINNADAAALENLDDSLMSDDELPDGFSDALNGENN